MAEKNVIRFNGSLDVSLGGYSGLVAETPIYRNGKQYFEFSAGCSNGYGIALMNKATGFTNTNPGNFYRCVNGVLWYINAATTGSYPRMVINGDAPTFEVKSGSFSSWKGAIAIDQGDKTLKLYYNGSLMHDLNYAVDIDYPLYPALMGCHQYGCSATFNFGETPFTYPIPDGYKSVYDAMNGVANKLYFKNNAIYGIQTTP